jgi:hypothetical protein
MGEFDPSVIGDLVVWYVVFLFSLTLHEGAHAGQGAIPAGKRSCPWRDLPRIS